MMSESDIAFKEATQNGFSQNQGYLEIDFTKIGLDRIGFTQKQGYLKISFSF